jgi:hypothetical protein
VIFLSSEKIIQEKFGLLTTLSKFVSLIFAHGNSGEKRKAEAGGPETDP